MKTFSYEVALTPVVVKICTWLGQLRVAFVAAAAQVHGLDDDQAYWLCAYALGDAEIAADVASDLLLHITESGRRHTQKVAR